MSISEVVYGAGTISEKFKVLRKWAETHESILLSDANIVNEFLGKIKTSNKPDADLKAELISRFGALEKKAKEAAKGTSDTGTKKKSKKEEGEDDDATDVEDLTKPPMEEEVALVKTKMMMTFDAAEAYDVKDLDEYCKRQEVNLADLELLKTIMSEVTFQGFNWEAVFNELRKRAKQAGLGKDLFIYHMRLLCAVYVERGSAFLRRGLLSLPNRTVKVYITALIKVYGIKLTRPRTGYSNVDVTITRIVAIFPDLVAGIIRQTNKSVICQDVEPSVPKWLKFPGGASLITKDDIGNALYQKWLNWYVAFGNIINPNQKVTIDNVKRFADAIYNSAATSTDVRKTVMTWT